MPAADWTRDEDYADLAELDCGALAWEALRRNPSYRDAFRSGEDLSRFGLVFPLDPDLPASAVDPVWRWEMAPAVAVRVAPAHAGALTMARLLERAAFRRTAESGLHLRFPNGLQVVVSGLVTPNDRVAAVLPFGRELVARISAVRALSGGMFGRWKEVGGLSRARRRRAVKSLRAWDGRAAGASYRQIAATMLGVGAMGSLEWRTSSERAVTIRLCAAGTVLAQGGHVSLVGGPGGVPLVDAPA